MPQDSFAVSKLFSCFFGRQSLGEGWGRGHLRGENVVEMNVYPRRALRASIMVSGRLVESV